MVLRHRDSPPPYELMNPGSLAAGGTFHRTGRKTGARPWEGLEGPIRWWTRAQQPIVVRVPSGLAVLLGVTFLVLLVLAYWAGQTHGRRQNPADRPIVLGGGTPPLAGRVASQRATASVPGPRADRADSARLADDAPADPRAVGLNYFVLAHYPRQEAQRLVEFLDGRGVEAAAFRAHNRRLFQVIALRGFARGEIDGAQRRQFEQTLRQLGHNWKSQRLGPDFSQSGIYLDRYENEPVAEVLLVRENEL